MQAAHRCLCVIAAFALIEVLASIIQSAQLYANALYFRSGPGRGAAGCVEILLAHFPVVIMVHLLIAAAILLCVSLRARVSISTSIAILAISAAAVWTILLQEDYLRSIRLALSKYGFEM